jgi:hypothetical protein
MIAIRFLTTDFTDCTDGFRPDQFGTAENTENTEGAFIREMRGPETD